MQKYLKVMNKPTAVTALTAMLFSLFGFALGVSVPVASAEGPSCTPGTVILYSDITTQDTTDAHPAVVVTPNGAWASISGATWIYSDALDVNGSSPAGTKTFAKTFTITGTPADSSLEIATDNTYTVSVNDHAVGSSANENNYNPSQILDVPATDLQTGSNTITFTVTNLAGGDPNPAGLDYALTVNNCVPVSPTMVTTTAATSVTSTGATVNGLNGSSNADNTSFWWGTTLAGPFTAGADPGSSEFPSGWTHDSGLGSALAGGLFNEPLTGLTPSTHYYFVAWSLVGGIWYPGTVLTFDTSATPVCSTDATTFDSFTLGSVNGQHGWSATGPYDQAIVNNTYGFPTFGCKSLRISNAVTSGSFGDQTFSYIISTPAGQSPAAANHFEAQFDIASTMLDQQSGLALSVSPDNGSGGRMSYLRFEDSASGINVFFDDVTDVGPLPHTASFNETQVAGGIAATPVLSRTTPHTVKFVMDFKDGPANDIVKIYIDGNLVHTGTSWEDYYRYDPEQTSGGNVVPTTDSLIFRAGGTTIPANSGNGFLFDNVNLSSSTVVPPSSVIITIEKYIDGVAASTTPTTAIFPMTEDYTIGSTPGTSLYTLSPTGINSPNAYEAITSPLDAGSNYTTNEVTGGEVVGADCSANQPYSLVGYSSGNTLAEALAAATSTTASFTDLTSNKYVIVWNHDCSTGTGPITGTVTSNGVLHVDSITSEASNANGIADNSYADGWKYTFHITAPMGEPNLSMKFADWLFGANIMPVANNMRIFSAQSSNATGEGSAITLTAANTYSLTPLHMVWDLATSTPAGRQVDVVVEVKIPLSTVNGSYSTSYGIQTTP